MSMCKCATSMVLEINNKIQNIYCNISIYRYYYDMTYLRVYPTNRGAGTMVCM